MLLVMSGIIDIAMTGVSRRLADRDIALELTAEAKAFIARASYSPSYGARPVKRYLQKHVETELAAMLIRGALSDGQKGTRSFTSGSTDPSWWMFSVR